VIVRLHRIRHFSLGALPLALGLFSGAFGASALEIAVAPFVDARLGGESGRSRATGETPLPETPDLASLVAERLASELGRRENVRVVSPDESGLPAVAEPEASQIRAWASDAGLDSIIVGQIFDPEPGAVDSAAWQGLIDVRSGHSGASIHRYPIEVQAGPDLEQAVVTQLARLSVDILDELAEVAAVASLPPVEAQRAGVSGDSSSASSSEEDEGSPFGIFEGDEPIRIDSEELEVITEGETRRLVFNRDVKVVQGDVELNADHLQAFYPTGSSQPDRLEAEGNVRVFEGDREIRCTRATYDRVGSNVLCKGDAVLIQGCDEVRGREIQLNIDDERIRVIGAASVVFRPKEDGEVACDRGRSR
jgi:lipopolysaccharide transport protein LptA